MSIISKSTSTNNVKEPTIKYDKVVPIWQPQGYSTNHIAKSLGELHKVKASHTGTLDPMASGVIIVLTGNKRYERYVLSDVTKTYNFDLLFGLSTDSYDGLGLITKNLLKDKVFLEKIKNTSKKDIHDICKKFDQDYMQDEPNYIQTVPIFSAQLYKGKKLFEYGHTNEDISKSDLPTKRGYIYNFKINTFEKILLSTVINQIIEQINNVKSNFRQKEIIEQYNNLLKEYDKNKFVYVANLTAKTSKGLYIRVLAQDLCEKLDMNGFLFNLQRTHNGKYTKKNSKTLIDLFGKNYDNILKLP